VATGSGWRPRAATTLARRGLAGVKCGNWPLIRVVVRSVVHRIRVGTVINNQVSGKAYRIEEFLGQGGFGTAYLARHVDRKGDSFGEPVCLKVTTNADMWHGEAFFAGLLGETKNVVKQLDAFPTTIVDGRTSRIVFMIEMEFMSTGTVHDACLDGRLPWPEDRVVRKIRGSDTTFPAPQHGGSPSRHHTQQCLRRQQSRAETGRLRHHQDQTQEVRCAG
jgi:hypothetical protein